MHHRRVRDSMGWITIPELLIRTAQRIPDGLAYEMRREGGWDRYTYGEVLSMVSRLAAFLRKEGGLGEREHYAIVGENRPEWPIGYLAIQWAGGVVIPLDPRATEADRRYVLTASGARGVICSKRFLEEMLEYAREHRGFQVICMDETSGAHDYPSVWSRYPKGAERVPLELDDLAVLLYTSGTTGNPKGVMLTHGNIVSNVDALQQIVYFDERDRFLSILPIHHVYEATVGFLAPLACGTPVTYARSLRPNVLLEDLRAVRPTQLLVVPLILEKLYLGILKRIKGLPTTKRLLVGFLSQVVRGLDPLTGGRASANFWATVRRELGLDRAKHIISGGAALPRWVSKGMERMGFPVIQGYGLSETSPVVSVNPPWRPKNESVGLPIPYAEVRIDSPGPDGVGEIAVRAPFVMKGYYKNEKATREVLDEAGWLYTGDLGWLDSEGYLYVTGRKKALIVSKGGKNIYPEEIEEKLLQYALVAEALVIGGVNPRTGEEEVQAIIYPNLELEAIRGWDEDRLYREVDRVVREVNRSLADYKRIRRFALRFEEFPKTSTNKIKRHLFQNVWIEPGKRRM